MKKASQGYVWKLKLLKKWRERKHGFCSKVPLNKWNHLAPTLETPREFKVSAEISSLFPCHSTRQSASFSAVVPWMKYLQSSLVGPLIASICYVWLKSKSKSKCTLQKYLFIDHGDQRMRLIQSPRPFPCEIVLGQQAQKNYEFCLATSPVTKSWVPWQWISPVYFLLEKVKSSTTDTWGGQTTWYTSLPCLDRDLVSWTNLFSRESLPCLGKSVHSREKITDGKWQNIQALQIAAYQKSWLIPDSRCNF